MPPGGFSCRVERDGGDVESCWLNWGDVIVMVSTAVMGRHMRISAVVRRLLLAGWVVIGKGEGARIARIGMDWRFYFEYFRLGRCDRRPCGMLGGGDGETFIQRGGRVGR